MSDLIDAVISHRAAVTATDNAKEMLAEAKEQLAAARDALIGAAGASHDAELVATAEGIGFCEDEIERLRAGEDGEVALAARARSANADLRNIAQAGGDVTAAATELTSAEADLAERRGEVRDIRKALKEHERRLEQLTSSIG